MQHIDPPFEQPDSWSGGRRGFLAAVAAGTVATAIVATWRPAAVATASQRVSHPRHLESQRLSGGARGFDPDRGNAPVELIVPGVVPVIFDTMSPAGNDATLVLRVTTMLTHAWFDAIAPYHATAVGVSSRLGRRYGTTRTLNIAILAASRPVLESLFPDRGETWSQLLDPALGLVRGRRDRLAARIGREAGEAVVADRLHDGMNQLGDADGRTHRPLPYADTTTYVPVNPPDELRDPSRWQPLTVADRLGIHRSQRFVTPQMSITRPYSYTDPAEFVVPAPIASSWQSDPAAYRDQADRVLAASAGLSDEQKMTAELYDNKIFGLGFSALYAAQSRSLDVAGFVEYDFLTNVAAFDAAIAVWHHKRQFDAVRPATAIGFLYRDEHVTAW